MLKPNVPNMPGMGAMTDALDFMKNLWSGMGLPGLNASGVPAMIMPTLSVEDIRKKISDLKAVESWLELNMNMLRGTIQALEVQAATISTLQSMGNALNATVNAGVANANPAPSRKPSEPAPPPPASKVSQAPPQPTSKDEADAATLTAPLVNAAAWWNMLQDQFNEAVNNAMTMETPKANGADHARPRAKAKATAARKRRSSK